MKLSLTKGEKDYLVVDFLDSQIARGKKRLEAVRATMKKFGILHPQTVYNTERRVRAKEWEVRHGKREA